MNRNGPTIPTTEFVPRPIIGAHFVGGLWGVALRPVGYAQMITSEVWNPYDPDEVCVGDQPVPWYPADMNSGVLYATVKTAWGVTVAIARAVPLS